MKMCVFFLIIILNVYPILCVNLDSSNQKELPNLRSQEMLSTKCSNCFQFVNSNFIISKKSNAELKEFCIKFCHIQTTNSITKYSVTVADWVIILVCSIIGGLLIVFAIISLICCCHPDCLWYNCCNNCDGKAIAPTTFQSREQQSYHAANQAYGQPLSGELTPGMQKPTPLQIMTNPKGGDMKNQLTNYNLATNRNLKDIPSPFPKQPTQLNDLNNPPLRPNPSSNYKQSDIPSPIQIMASNRSSQIKNPNLNYNDLPGRTIIEKPLQIKGYS